MKKQLAYALAAVALFPALTAGVITHDIVGSRATPKTAVDQATLTDAQTGMGKGVTDSASVTSSSSVGQSGGGGTFPNTSGANVFISATGSDSGSNCQARLGTPTATPPAANTVCATASRAYSLANAGDTVWVLPGSYTSGNPLGFNSGTPPTSKTVNDSTNCHASHECVYFIPQPGQASNVVTHEIDWKASYAPDHMYYKGFIRGACPSFSQLNFSGSFAGTNDITVDGFKALLPADPDCVPYLAGAHKYTRILNGDFEHYASNSNVGMPIFAATADGESADHRNAPQHFLIDNTRFYQPDGGATAGHHQDCVHWYAASYSTISRSKFVNCYDSSILAEGLDENGYNEHNVIENNWFGPTVLGVNNCCLRGDSTPSNETFDGWTIRFNSSTSTWMNKTGLVLNDVSFIGNVGLGDVSCVSGTNVIYAYNQMGSSACGGTDLGGRTNSTVKFTDTSVSGLNLHVLSGSSVLDFVPGSQANGCLSVAVDYDGGNRGSPCDAGADEFGSP